jgi:formylglycine-generating enzyme required for sulfatase activity
MAGNVWEWTSTLERAYPYQANDGREDINANGKRIMRGGSYIHSARNIRCADRHAFVPGTRDGYIGFRVARGQAKQTAHIELDWCDVPAGEFWMGNDPRAFHDLALPSEYSQYFISLPEFFIAQMPVTNAEYEMFTQATDYSAPSHWVENKIPRGKENHPATNVSWDDARAFCEWSGTRLLTEAEWEKAARGIDGRVYPWGNEPPDESRANYAQDVKTHSTTSVNQFLRGASPYGVLDLAGNVWEWVSSLYREYPYNARDGREDLDSRAQRVLRGGSFYSPNENFIRCAARSLSYPQRRRDHIGFRVARK